jgi:TonB family protein
MPDPVVLLVQVHADGTTGQVVMLRPSASDAFNSLAVEYAVTMRWQPATKEGLPVAAWTQVRLEPIHQ